MTTVKIREFNEHDWESHSGASTWPNGESPLIRVEIVWEAVVDRSGIEITIEAGDNEEGDLEFQCWDLFMEFPSQEFAKVFLAGLPKDLTIDRIKKLGFNHAATF